MERAVAAMTSGLRKLGHRVFILTSAPQAHPEPGIITLERLRVPFPCDDRTLREAIRRSTPGLARELAAVLSGCRADVAVYVDALWGLGSLAAVVRHPARRVLTVHVVGHDTDLRPALAAARQVIAPSQSVLAEAAARGYHASRWAVVPNPC
jgi:Glycosyltransferase Family 4